MLFFARSRELAGASEATLSMQPGSTTATLISRLLEQASRLALIRSLPAVVRARRNRRQGFLPCRPALFTLCPPCSVGGPALPAALHTLRPPCPGPSLAPAAVPAIG